MSDDHGEKSIQRILDALQERAKELNCLYRVDEILSRGGRAEEVYRQLIQLLPTGWQYPDICQSKILVDGRTSRSAGYVESPWCMSEPIVCQGRQVGEISVSYTQERTAADEGPFLKEERRLISAIAERIGLFIMQQRLRRDHQSWENAVQSIEAHKHQPWQVVLEFLRRTDPRLLIRMTRKMINHLCWNDVPDAEALLQERLVVVSTDRQIDENRPLHRDDLPDTSALTGQTFDLAAKSLSEREILSCLQVWINEEKSTFLLKSLEHPGTGLSEVVEAIDRYQAAGIDELELPLAVRTSLKVALLRRLFVDQLEFINLAKEHVEVRDFYELLKHLIHPANSQGKLGGKGAGLFLASRIVANSAEYADVFGNLRIPRTWYVASDAMLEFIHYNNLEEVYNSKYMETERIRSDYPHVVQVFKNSQFPPEIVQGLAAALDDFQDQPIIVRSSSLLEDRVGSAFSGKYKSLFLANQGSKRERLEALKDAIAEVYASVFSPDPIKYRSERGLLDFREEMAIMVQEVVGRRVGRYFLPAFSGVAFSSNEFRWSPRIRREDGLVRLVPGLGTRAVDRMSDDYPVLFAPGLPQLRVNVTADEVMRYSPKRIDVINLERNAFETRDLQELLRECGDDYPLLHSLISIVDEDRIRPPSYLESDWPSDQVVVTFEGLLLNGKFVRQMQTMLGLLHERIGMPVDIEFTHDGEHLYLVQCRTQSHSKQHAPAAIPRDVPREHIVFWADRHISNGQVPDLTHIVYVDPEGYSALPEEKMLREVGRAVGRLNALLPKRQFLLMGPGRWGSRGDVRLGVSVTYSEISNTAVLIEIARKRGSYVPELSFGTHFFQDLVEAEIRYVPLYPDDPAVVLNESFLKRSRNVLKELLPEFAHLTDTLRVIDVRAETGGRVLRVLMNADLDEAMGLLVSPDRTIAVSEEAGEEPDTVPDDHWRWRLTMAEQIAARLDADRFGVKAIYVFGSTKNATAVPASDIDLIIHDHGDERQRADLDTWLAGWSASLAEMNYLRTGYRAEGLLDVRYVTDEDIARQTSYAVKIDAVTDAARRLEMES